MPSAKTENVHVGLVSLEMGKINVNVSLKLNSSVHKPSVDYHVFIKCSSERLSSHAGNGL